MHRTLYVNNYCSCIDTQLLSIWKSNKAQQVQFLHVRYCLDLHDKSLCKVVDLGKS